MAGASLSMLASVVAVILLILEVTGFLYAMTDTQVVIDSSPKDDLLRTNFNISFMPISREHVPLDVSYSLGSVIIVSLQLAATRAPFSMQNRKCMANGRFQGWFQAALVGAISLMFMPAYCAAATERTEFNTYGTTARGLLKAAKLDNCEQFADVKNHTVNCFKTGGTRHALSKCGKCAEPQGPELNFDWGSEYQTRFRNVPLEPRMRCQGIRDFTRLCYFKDILWDLETESWVVFGEYEGLLKTLSADFQEDEPWLRLDRQSPAPGKDREHHMHIDWRPTSEMPTGNTMLTSPLEAVHLRVMLNPMSIGHFIRDNLLELVNVPMSFGLDPRKFVWLQADSDLQYAEAFQSGASLLTHYHSWLPLDKDSPAPFMLLSALIRQSKVAVDIQKDTAPEVRYIRFPKLLAGRGGNDMHAILGSLTEEFDYKASLTWSHLCQPHNWRMMRSIAYANNGLVHKPAYQQTPLVLFIDGTEKERRNFPNTEALLPELRNKFPDAIFRYEKISTLTGLEQVELLSRTTVLVSSIGSRSFRMSFLPDGAQVILVGPPEKFGSDENDLQPLNLPFREVEWCWGSVGYVNVKNVPSRRA